MYENKIVVGCHVKHDYILKIKSGCQILNTMARVVFIIN